MTLDPWHIFTANFGSVPMPYTAFATILDMILYLAITVKVGHGRGKHNIDAPNTDGSEAFKILYRVQMNTLEQLALHLPLLWIAAFAMSDVFAATLGFVWLFARILYAVRYYQKPSRRIKGFVISMAANALLLIGALVGTIASL
jgi:glutathione S-transferase